MSELDALFKKKSKSKKKVVNIESLSHKLEGKTKMQEELDREEEERVKREKEHEEYMQQLEKEDSEWHDFGGKDLEITSTKIKDMGIEDHQVDEPTEAEQEAQMKPAREWNVPKTEADGDDETKPTDTEEVAEKPPTEEEIKKDEKEKGAYVPVHKRHAMGAGGGGPGAAGPWGGAGAAAPKVDDKNEFPSLAAADKLDTERKEQERLIEQRKLKKLEEEQARQAADAAATAKAASARSATNTYVPIHLRNQQQQQQQTPAAIKAGQTFTITGIDPKSTLPSAPKTEEEREMGVGMMDHSRGGGVGGSTNSYRAPPTSARMGDDRNRSDVAERPRMNLLPRTVPMSNQQQTMAPPEENKAAPTTNTTTAGGTAYVPPWKRKGPQVADAPAPLSTSNRFDGMNNEE